MKTTIFLRSAALVALLGSTACNGVSAVSEVQSQNIAEVEAINGRQDSRLSARIADRLDLSADQQAALNERLGADRAPGSLWHLASALQEVMTESQREQLLSMTHANAGRRMDDARRSRGTDLRGRNRASGRAEAFGDRRARRGPDRPSGASSGLEEILTEDQQSTLREIRENHRAELQEIRESRRNGGLTREEARERLQALNNEMRADIDALLTDEQRAHLRELRGDRRQAFRTRGQRQMRGDAPGVSSEARNAALQLTPEQAARLDELHKELREKRTASVRQRGGRDGIRTNNRELMSEYRESLESVLDARQLEVFQIHAALMGMARDHTFARSRGPHRNRNLGR